MQNNIVTIIRQLEDANASGNAEQAVRLLDIMNQLLQEDEDDGTVEMTDDFSDENKEDVDDEKKEDNQYDDMPILVSITDEDENESKDDLDHPVETDEESEYDDMPELISDIEMDDTMIVDIHVDGNQVLVYYR